jgi:hypothetical protein
MDTKEYYGQIEAGIDTKRVDVEPLSSPKEIGKIKME